MEEPAVTLNRNDKTLHKNDIFLKVFDDLKNFKSHQKYYGIINGKPYKCQTCLILCFMIAASVLLSMEKFNLNLNNIFRTFNQY